MALTNGLRPIGPVALAIVLVSCASDLAVGHHEQSTASVARTPDSDAQHSSSSFAPTGERLDICQTIRADVAQVMNHTPEHERLFRDNRDRLALFGDCHHTENGVWAIVLDDLVPVVRDMGAVNRLDGHWAIAHTDPVGDHRVQRSPALPSVGRDARDDPRNFVAGHPTSLRIHDPVLFDYDGHGESEIVVVADEETVDYGTVTRGRVWAFTGDAIEPYPPARDIVVIATRDADRDGRPDLAMSAPYVGDWVDYCSRHNTAVAGPTLIAHSRADGSFSMTDEVAVAAAREVCPEDPAPIVVVDGSGAVDNARTARNVACARIRGMSAARVAASVRSGCRHGSRAGGRCTEGCNDVGMLARWAEMTPPVQLPAPRRRR